MIRWTYLLVDKIIDHRELQQSLRINATKDKILLRFYEDIFIRFGGDFRRLSEGKTLIAIVEK